jgi:type II secretory pathway component PulC
MKGPLFVRGRNAVLVLAGFFCAAGYAHAAGLDDLSYDSRGKRDPLIPWKAEQLPQEADEVSDIKIEGIIFDPERGSYAILNGTVVREGEALGGYRVRRIEKKRVLLSRQNKEIELAFQADE